MAEPTPLKPAYLICGTDKPKVRRSVLRLRQRIVGETGSDLNVATFDARDQRVTAVLEAADTAPFVLGTRLLLIVDADRWPVADRDRVADYLKDPAPSTCLALVGATFKKTERLTKTVEKLGQVLRFDLPKRHELGDWVQERARAMRLRLGAREASRLINHVGDDPDLLEVELAKLATYARGAPVSADDIDLVCSPTVGTRIFALTEAVGRRDARAAFLALEDLYAKESAGEIFYSLLRHIRQLHDVVQLSPQTPASEVAVTLGVHPYAARRLVEQRGNFDRASLGRALIALAEAEARLRGKARFSLEPEKDADRLVLELALARLIDRA